LTARDLVYRADGALRAPWRLVGYLLLLAAAVWLLTRLALLIARPTGSLSWQLAAFGTVLAGVVLAHVVMLRWVDHRPWTFVGLGREQLDARRLAVGLSLGGLGIAVPSLLLLGVRWLEAVPAAGGAGDWLGYALFTAVFFLPQSLAEEMMVRGYPFAVLREALGGGAALLITSIAFGLLHLANPGANARSLLLVTLAGLFLGGVLLITRSLYAAWMAHFAWNWAMAGLLHTAVSGISLAAPDYRLVDSGPDWATGGAWGPEGGVGAALGMLGGLAVLTMWRRRRAAPSTELERSTHG
jgi:membrane protease YdiL (CAAX protease family)